MDGLSVQDESVTLRKMVMDEASVTNKGVFLFFVKTKFLHPLKHSLNLSPQTYHLISYLYSNT